MTYEELLIEADSEGLIVREKPLAGSDGRIKGKRIAIRKNIPTLAKKADVLAEEMGHYHTGVGRIIDSNKTCHPCPGILPPDIRDVCGHR